MFPVSHQTVEGYNPGSAGICSLVRFEALQESHIHIKASWMYPLLGWSQSCTHLELPRLQDVNKDGDEEMGVREEGKQTRAGNVSDADELD